MPLGYLVVTGKDIPENLTLFFGRNQVEVVHIHRGVRHQLFLRHPPGSWADKKVKSMNLDQNCPPWTPREASKEEAREIEGIKAMQETIRQYMGSRALSEITDGDVSKMLSSEFGTPLPIEVVEAFSAAFCSM
ncbi:hypothetical protein F5Y13DRAFT_1401 [Hypoxylon sp. FL1857]|nr:hypothetical protein F5Y13DRAFT_1401 [Hypoxylon sp. FL1857]